MNDGGDPANQDGAGAVPDDRAGAVHRISVVGLGFVGLSLAVTNAKAGFETIGVDIDTDRITGLKAGRPGFFEPKLDEMLAEAINQGSITFTTDLDYAVQNSGITFLTVGTPLVGDGTEVDLSYVRKAAGQIARSLEDKREFHLVVIKSTLPPMTTQDSILPIFGDLIGEGRVDVIVNPEFLREGMAIEDLLKPHLIVIGASDQRGASVLEQYYRDFYGEKTTPEVIQTSMATAELIKYANNAFLATKISFINSIGSLCQAIPGTDVNTVAYAIGKDSRIGPQFLRAGPGFGGSCLPKDLMGLIRLAETAGGRSDLFEAVKEVNDGQFLRMVEMVREQGALARGKVVAVLGLAFKKDTDDVRDAVSTKVVASLLEHGLSVRVHDPMAMGSFERIFGGRVLYSSTVDGCLEGAECCIILTDWDAYKELEPDDFLGPMRACNIIDARRVLDARKFKRIAGFRAMGLGG